MALGASFWIDATREKDPPVGKLYLEVSIQEGSDWPEVWTPEAIWDDDCLELITVSYRGSYRGQEVIVNIIEVEPSSNPAIGHWVTGKCRVPSGGAHIPIIPPDPHWCKRTDVNTEDLIWLFSHWRDVREYPLDLWWLDKRDLQVARGLHLDQVEWVRRVLEGIRWTTLQRLARAVRPRTP